MACIATSRTISTTCMRRTASLAAPRPRPSICRGITARCNKSRAGAVVVRAIQEGPQGGDPVGVFLKKYDFTSAMMGALVVTGYFWSTGQDPIQALGITACSTVFAVVANELLFSSEK